MPSLNRVLLMGNLTKDPELKYTPKGTAVASLGLAINRNYTTESGEKREEVTFVDVELFGRTAELAGEYLKKGRPVFIEGRLKLDSWDDKTTGQKRSKMKVIGETMQFLGGKEDSDAPASRQDARGAPSSRSPDSPRVPRPQSPPRSNPPDPDLDGETDSEIPF